MFQEYQYCVKHIFWIMWSVSFLPWLISHLWLYCSTLQYWPAQQLSQVNSKLFKTIINGYKISYKNYIREVMKSWVKRKNRALLLWETISILHTAKPMMVLMWILIELVFPQILLNVSPLDSHWARLSSARVLQKGPELCSVPLFEGFLKPGKAALMCLSTGPPTARPPSLAQKYTRTLFPSPPLPKSPCWPLHANTPFIVGSGGSRAAYALQLLTRHRHAYSTFATLSG